MIALARIEQILRVLNTDGLSERTLARLRRDFCDMHFTLCDDDDMGTARPVQSLPGCNIYLVDGRDHCLRITTDPAAATGVVLAAVEDGFDL